MYYDMELIQEQPGTYMYSAELKHAKEASNHVVIINSLKVHSDDAVALVEMMRGLSRQLMDVCNEINGE